jgi:hypothetical protein
MASFDTDDFMNGSASTDVALDEELANLRVQECLHTGSVETSVSSKHCSKLTGTVESKCERKKKSYEDGHSLLERNQWGNAQRDLFGALHSIATHEDAKTDEGTKKLLKQMCQAIDGFQGFCWTPSVKSSTNWGCAERMANDLRESARSHDRLTDAKKSNLQLPSIKMVPLQWSGAGYAAQRAIDAKRINASDFYDPIMNRLDELGGECRSFVNEIANFTYKSKDEPDVVDDSTPEVATAPTKFNFKSMAGVVPTSLFSSGQSGKDVRQRFRNEAKMFVLTNYPGKRVSVLTPPSTDDDIPWNALDKNPQAKKGFLQAHMICKWPERQPKSNSVTVEFVTPRLTGKISEDPASNWITVNVNGRIIKQVAESGKSGEYVLYIPVDKPVVDLHRART